MSGTSSPRILIAFYSRTRVTEQLALSIRDGAEAAGAVCHLRRCRELVSDDVMASVPGWKETAEAMNSLYEPPTPTDAESADAIILGTPTRFGNMSSELKAYVDSLGALWYRGALNGKVGSVFASTSTLHGGNETTLFTMFPPLVHLGLIIVPPGYASPVMFNGGTPYGATAVSGQTAVKPTSADLAAAFFQGERVAVITARLVSTYSKIAGQDQ